MNCKLYIGCVSKNTIDSVIEYSNENSIHLGLIPSRRQIDYDGGYVGFRNQNFRDYVKSKSEKVIIQRDHCGPLQGKYIDDGIISILDDSRYYDLIHIDPWKKYNVFEEGLQNTQKLIEHCLNQNYKGKFEIATEQSIREFSFEELEELIIKCSKYPIEYVVIQSGTSLKENINTGDYDEKKLIKFLEIINKYKLKSKEHNGDYISESLIKQKFKLGLNAINIAPEFGLIETNCYLKIIENDIFKLNKFYDICYESGFWKKWVNKDFDINNKIKLIQICGHYVLENDYFQKEIKNKIEDLTINIKKVMKNKIKNILH